MTCNPEKMATSSPEPLRGRCGRTWSDHGGIIVVIFGGIFIIVIIFLTWRFVRLLGGVGDTAKPSSFRETHVHLLPSTLSFLLFRCCSSGTVEGEQPCAAARHGVADVLLVELKIFLPFSNFNVFFR
jgi:hypothetical protein